MSVAVRGTTKRLALAFGSGALFAIGLAISGMTQPQKVVGFLDLTGDWDPSLALVMGGALAVYLPGYFLLRRKRQRPFFAKRFLLSKQKKVDTTLVVGAITFGVGWGIAGFCPGPAIVSVSGLGTAALAFVPAMIFGAILGSVFLKARRSATAKQRATG